MTESVAPNHREHAARFLRMLTDYRNRLSRSDVVWRPPIFFARDSIAVLRHDVLSPRKSLSSTHEGRLFRFGYKKVACIKRAGLPSPEVSPAQWGLIVHSPLQERLYSEMEKVQIAQRWRMDGPKMLQGTETLELKFEQPIRMRKRLVRPAKAGHLATITTKNFDGQLATRLKILANSLLFAPSNLSTDVKTQRVLFESCEHRFACGVSTAGTERKNVPLKERRSNGGDSSDSTRGKHLEEIQNEPT
jgi:hypothetical protein